MDQQHINRVEAYFGKQMSGEQIRQFKHDLSHNAELKQVYFEYQLAMDAVDQQVEEELRDQFKTWDRKGKAEKPLRWLTPNFWKIAASLALIACLYYLLISSDQFLNGEELSISYYELPVSPGGNMGKGEEKWSNGIQAFEKKDFDEAIAEWTQIEKPSAEQTYYLAHAYFNTNKYAQAAPLFKILSEGTSVYSFNAEWYLALSYLALNSKAEFMDEIAIITKNPYHPYLEEAIELRKKARKVFPKEK
jgi:tetratricopeptide (TPR) repeat protein